MPDSFRLMEAFGNLTVCCRAPEHYLKCYEARHILVEEWKLEYTHNQFLSLVDPEKLISLPIYQFGLILKSEMLTEGEKGILKRKRQQAKKNVATEQLRKRNKEQDMELEESVRVLEGERKGLLQAREELREEIALYQQITDAEV